MNKIRVIEYRFDGRLLWHGRVNNMFYETLQQAGSVEQGGLISTLILGELAGFLVMWREYCTESMRG